MGVESFPGCERYWNLFEHIYGCSPVGLMGEVLRRVSSTEGQARLAGDCFDLGLNYLRDEFHHEGINRLIGNFSQWLDERKIVRLVAVDNAQAPYFLWSGENTEGESSTLTHSFRLAEFVAANYEDVLALTVVVASAANSWSRGDLATDAGVKAAHQVSMGWVAEYVLSMQDRNPVFQYEARLSLFQQACRDRFPGGMPDWRNKVG